MIETSNVYSPLAESDSSDTSLSKGASPKSHTIPSTTSNQQSNYCHMTQPKPSFHNLPLSSLYQEARTVNSICAFYPVSDIHDVTSINAPTKDPSNLQESSSPTSEVMNQNQLPDSSFKPDTSRAQVTKRVEATTELSNSVPLVSEQQSFQHQQCSSPHVTNTEDISSSSVMNLNVKSNGREFTKSNSTKETVLNHDLVILIDSNGK